MRTLVVAIAGVLLSGCAAPLLFDKPGVAPGEGQGDVTDCQVEALKRVPPNNQLRTIPGGPVTTYASCYGASCTATSYGGQARHYTVDANARLRQQAMIQCMMEKGYTLRK